MLVISYSNGLIFSDWINIAMRKIVQEHCWRKYLDQRGINEINLGKLCEERLKDLHSSPKQEWDGNAM